MEPSYRETGRLRSFLRARDDSIISYGPDRNHAKKNLLGNIFEFEEKNCSLVREDDTIDVFLRLKPGKENGIYKYTSKSIKCTYPTNCQASKNVRDGEVVTKEFQFSHIFSPTATQSDVFNYVVKARLIKFLNGENCYLLTYGASGAGKTYTLMGNEKEPGIIIRALDYIFKTVPPLEKVPTLKPCESGVSAMRLGPTEQRAERLRCVQLLQNFSCDKKTFLTSFKMMQQRLSSEPAATLEEGADVQLGVWVSFAEIYNEFVYDLLVKPEANKPRTKLKLCNNSGITYIKDLNNIYVTSGIEAYMLMEYGRNNLNYAATSINSNSSRSHCIFTISLVQEDEEGNHRVTRFNLCDLAGSERNKNTNNVGERLLESNNINSSLSVLWRCISNMRIRQRVNEKQLVPFRESKLTQLFQRALCGHDHIGVIININPREDIFDETLHVLNFSAITQRIVVKQPAKQEPQTRRRSVTMSQLMNSSIFSKMQNKHEDEVSELLEIIANLEEVIRETKKDYIRCEAESIDAKLKFSSDLIEYKQRIRVLESKVLQQNEIIQSLKDELRNALRDRTASSIDDSVVVLDDSVEAAPEHNVTVDEMRLKVLELEEELEQSRIDKEEMMAIIGSEEAAKLELRAEIIGLKEKIDLDESML